MYFSLLRTRQRILQSRQPCFQVYNVITVRQDSENDCLERRHSAESTLGQLFRRHAFALSFWPAAIPAGVLRAEVYSAAIRYCDGRLKAPVSDLVLFC